MDIGKIDPATVVQSVTGTRGNKESLKKAAEGFESYFISIILQELQNTTSLSKKGGAEEKQMSLVYGSMCDFLAKKGIGIKDMIMKYIDNGTKVPYETGDKKKQEV
jgi:Rod binding domain-containing protein